MPKLRFRLSTLLVVAFVFSCVLAGARYWFTPPKQIGPCWGHPRIDFATAPDGILGLHTSSQQEGIDGDLQGQVVAHVQDVSAVTTERIREALAAIPEDYPVRRLHFLERVDPNRGLVRSFSPVTSRELRPCVPGALLSVMVLDQLSAKLPDDEHVRINNRAKKIDYSLGETIQVEYTNDWGYFYLRSIEANSKLLRNVKVIPWSSREVIDAEASTQPAGDGGRTAGVTAEVEAP